MSFKTKRLSHSKRLVIKENLAILAMALPGILYLILFNYLPMFGAVLAFKKFNYEGGIFGSPWCGLDNFTFLFKTEDAFIITRNTILYNMFFIVVGTFLSITLALLLNEITHKRMAKIYQTIAIMPNFLSWVAVGFAGFAFLSLDPSGFINSTMVSMGKDPIAWYSNPQYWPTILVTAGLWKTVGFNSVIYLAALAGVSTDYLEAAAIDGAGKWKQICHIMLPSIRTTVIILFIMSIGKIFFSDFGLFYQMSHDQGTLYPATLTIDYYVYNALKRSGDISMSAAASVYQSVIGFILVVVANFVVRKVDNESAMF